MLWKAAISQTKNLLKRKEAIFTFYILLIMVLVNFLGNVLAFQGSDVVEMYHPMKLLFLSYNITNYNASGTLLLIQLYPILVVCPAGFALSKEYQLGVNVYMSSRMGIRSYKISKLLTAFLTTMLIFTIPFLLEVVLNCISFPLSAKGDLSNWGYYNSFFIEWVHNYFMSDFYLKYPFLYAITGIIIFGAVSGVLGAFTVAVSSVIKVKYNIFLFFPVVLLLNATIIFQKKGAPSILWYDFLFLFNEVKKNVVFFAMGIISLLLFIVIAGAVSSRKDCL